MKLTQLEYFCTAVECQSITAAAKKLYVTQPAISGAIRELEKEFSVSLFSHARNKMTLTDEGRIFYERSEQLLREAESAKQQLSDLGSARQTVKVGIPIEPRIEQKVGLLCRKSKYTPSGVESFISFVRDYPLFPEEP